MKQLGLPGTRRTRLSRADPVSHAGGESMSVFVPGIMLRSLNVTFRSASMGARMAAAAKAKKQRGDVTLALRCAFGAPPVLPVEVTVVRVAPGTLDAHDNLPGACKHVVDAIAAWIGVDDRNPGITWNYDQRRDGRTVGVAIRIEVRR